MARYIDAEKYENELWNSLKGYRKAPEICAVKNCIVELEEQPTADVVEVRHGYWIWLEGNFYECSECPTQTEVDEKMNIPLYKFCPYCGAIMDGGTE